MFQVPELSGIIDQLNDVGTITGPAKTAQETLGTIEGKIEDSLKEAINQANTTITDTGILFLIN